MPLPHIGIDEEVRVCDGCYIKLKLAKVAKKDALPPLPGLRPATSQQQQQQPATSSSRQASGDAQDDTFDEDMKKAIEMSLKEAEQYKSGYGAGYTPSQPTSTNPPATTQVRNVIIVQRRGIETKSMTCRLHQRMKKRMILILLLL